MNLRYLQYFHILAQEEHVTSAAEKLFISQPSLSNAMAALEKELGVDLFEKQGRGIVLTKGGRLYANYVHEAFACLEKGEHALQEYNSPSHGTIDIAYYGTLGIYYIPRLIQNFRKNEDCRQIQIRLHHCTESQIHEGLSQGEFDLAFCSEKRKAEDFFYRPVNSEAMRVLVYDTHPFAEKESISLKELVGQPFIAFSRPGGLQKVINEQLREYQISLTPSYWGNEGTDVAGQVSAGMGIAIIPEIPLPHTNVRYLPIIEPIPPRMIYLCQSTVHSQAPAVTRFVQYVLNNCI